MTNRAAAMRYARALLEVAENEGDPEQVERDLSGFVTLMKKHELLNDSLISPAVPPASKRAVINELVTRAGDLSEITARLLTLLAERDRLRLLGEILDGYRAQLRTLRGAVRARITTASPLPSDRVEAIARQIQDALGRKVTLNTEVDPAMIGGALTQIGSTVFDGSVSRHLERLRQRFLNEA